MTELANRRNTTTDYYRLPIEEDGLAINTTLTISDIQRWGYLVTTREGRFERLMDPTQYMILSTGIEN